MEEQRQAARLQRQLQQEQAYLLSLQQDHKQQQQPQQQQQAAPPPEPKGPAPQTEPQPIERVREVNLAPPPMPSAASVLSAFLSNTADRSGRGTSASVVHNTKLLLVSARLLVFFFLFFTFS